MLVCDPESLLHFLDASGGGRDRSGAEHLHRRPCDVTLERRRRVDLRLVAAGNDRV